MRPFSFDGVGIMRYKVQFTLTTSELTTSCTSGFPVTDVRERNLDIAFCDKKNLCEVT